MLADAVVHTVDAPDPGPSWLRLGYRMLPVFSLAASRGAAVLAQFLVQLAVSSMAGAAGLGVLQLFTSWTCIAGEVLARGLPTRAMRLVSVAYADRGAHVIERILRDARRQILRLWLSLLVLALVPAALLLTSQATSDWIYYGHLLLAAVLVAPLFSLCRLYAESLKATGASLAAVTLESLTSPVALLLVCALCWLTGQTLAAATLLVTFGFSLAITPIALHRKLQRQLARLQPAPGSPEHDLAMPAPPRGELSSLWGSSVLSIGFMQLPFIVLPFYADTGEIGVFAVAHKLINVITTLLLLLAAVFGPAFARTAAQRDASDLLSLLRRTQAISVAVFLPLALLLIALAGPLSGLFGQEFGDLHLLLVILTAGQMINAATGLPGVLLNMAGAAASELFALVIALLVAVAGSIWVGPVHGVIGLAMVFSGSIALKNILSYTLARQHLATMR